MSDELNQLSEENEELRDQLGLGPGHKVDLSPLRRRKRNEMESVKEEHKVLFKEVQYAHLYFNSMFCRFIKYNCTGL